MSKFLYILTISSLFLVNSCKEVDIDLYQDQTPQITIQNFFDGNLIGHGIIHNDNNIVERTYTLEIEAKWYSKTGFVEKIYRFNDGEIITKKLSFKLIDDFNFIIESDEIVGYGQGSQSGNTIKIDYIFKYFDESGSKKEVNVTDWLYKTDNNNLINITEYKKLGGRIGDKYITSISKTDE